MPYSGGNDPNLPANVKKKSRAIRNKWVATWNSVFASCQKRGGKNCEGEAYRIANGVIKDLEGGSMFYIDLAQLKSGKTFDAVVPGKFTDMFGRSVIFKKTELETYVKNTKEAITATTTESGEVVGLPIDAQGHDKGDGAGWIVDAVLEGDKVRLVPKWTEVGLELIKKGIRRFFSPTIDTKNKTILGGSLTNWPATRDRKGKILLRPIELEDAPPGFWVVEEDQEFEDEDDPEDAELQDSLNDELSSVHKAFSEKFMPKREKEMTSLPYIIEVFEGYAIVRDGGKHFSAPFTKDEKGNVEFSDRKEWTQVRRTWIEAALNQINDVIAKFQSMFTNADEAQNTEEVLSMDITKEELQTMIAQTVAGAMKAQADLSLNPPKPDPDADADSDGKNKDPFNVLQFLELEGAGDEYVQAVKQAMVELYDQTRKRGAEEAAKMIAGVRREAHVNEFVSRITGGDEEHPQGIVVPPDEMQKFILSLDPEQAEFIQPLLEKIAKGKGLVPFDELGHGKEMEGTTPLPEYYQQKLDAKELKLSDLEDPMLALGDLTQYDLSKWREKE